MISKPLYRVSEVAEILNVSRSGVKKWIRDGKIKAIKIGKLWMVPEDEVKKFLKGLKSKEVKAVIYARVNPSEKDELEKQIERLRNYASAKGYKVVDVIAEAASGIEEDREGLRKVFELVEKNQVDIVLVEYRDRLLRFGFGVLKRYFESHGVEIEVLEEYESHYRKGLLEDITSLMSSLSEKAFGKSQKHQSILKMLKEMSEAI